MIDKTGYWLDAEGEAYEVLANAVHTETGEKLVIYRPLLSSCPTAMARPESTWNDIIDGTPRFRQTHSVRNIVDE